MVPADRAVATLFKLLIVSMSPSAAIFSVSFKL